MIWYWYLNTSYNTHRSIKGTQDDPGRSLDVWWWKTIKYAKENVSFEMKIEDCLESGKLYV